MATETLPTAEELRAAFRYDPDTGLLYWRIQPRQGYAGDIAGSLDRTDRRVQVRFRWRLYRRYRIAWCMMTGKWPMHQIDHVDGDPANDRWCNLRAATHAENCRNSRSRGQTSLLKGVSWNTRRRKWVAQISGAGPHRNLGYFTTEEAAHEAYRKEAIIRYGEFAGF